MLRSIRLTVTVGLAAALMAPAADASHNLTRSQRFYPTTWQRPMNVTFAFDQGFPGGAWRDRVAAGAAVWRRPNFAFNAGGNVTGIPRACPEAPTERTRSVVHYHRLDGYERNRRRNRIASNVRCVMEGTNRIVAFRQVYDSDERDTAVSCSNPTGRSYRISRWYIGSRATVPRYCLPESNAQTTYFTWRIDLQSAAAHEMGHATGFSGPYDSRYNPKSYCSADNRNRETMCYRMVAGQARQRTLGERDAHIFGDIYP